MNSTPKHPTSAADEAPSETQVNATTCKQSSIELVRSILIDETLAKALQAIPAAEAQQILDRQLNAADAQTDQPHFIHMAGIPGSGKSTYAKQLYQTRPQMSGALFIAFDQVMEQLSGYQALDDPIAAFAAWELPARALGYQLLLSGLEAGCSILFDHSGAHPAHLPLMTALSHENRYRTEMVYLKAEPKQVLSYIQQREKITRRHTPEQLVHERYQLLEDLMPQYEKTVHQFSTYSYYNTQ